MEKIKKENRSKMMRSIMSTAWRISRIEELPIGQCMKSAWDNFKLKERLGSGVVAFTFVKVDGTIRKAVGTLCPELMPKGAVESSRNSNPHPRTQIYYDLEAEGFRRFRKANLLSI